MPYQQKNSPYLWVNKEFKGVGRIQRSTGTENKTTAKAMEAMLDHLYRAGKGVWLDELKAGRINLPTLYSKHLNGQLETGINPVLVQPFDNIIAWVEENQEYAETTKISNRSLAKKLVKLYPRRTVKDMPQILREFRVYCLKEDVKITRGFNSCRSLLQAYATAQDGKYKNLWREITNIPLIKYEKSTKQKLSYKDVMDLTKKLIRGDLKDPEHSHDHAYILWTLLLTGFRKSEYLGRWDLYTDRIKVICVKQKQSGIKERQVPVITHFIDMVYNPGDTGYVYKQDVSMTYTAPFDPGTGFQQFERALRDASNRTVSPHTLRHTYRHWLELAGIPHGRCEYYMGHKPNLSNPQQVYSAYDDKTIVPHLKNDAEAMEKWLKEQKYQHMAAYQEHWIEFDPNLADEDEPPVPIMVKTPKKRIPRPSRKPHAVAPV